LEAGAEVFLQLFEGLELAHGFREAIVERWKLLGLDFLDEDGERRLLAPEIAETLGEGVAEFEDRAGPLALELVVQLRGPLLGADLV
jgi:hypothetical protein